jgi:nucleotide-binding universal stress UspA family protein
MSKKILLAVGDCVYSKHAVRYLSTVSSAAKDISMTLFHVQPMVPSIISESAKTYSEVGAVVDSLLQKEVETAKCVVGELNDLAVEQGIRRDRIEVVTEPMKAGMARDILDKGEKDGYQAIVLARRGLTPSRDFFIGTTAAKVVDHALNTPVWVVDGETAPLNMLIAIDGSPDSVYLLEYVLSMVGPNPDLHLTLFHVLPSLRHYYSVDFQRANLHLEEVMHRKDRERMEMFYARAFDILKKHGIQDAQVRTMTAKAMEDVSTCVLREAKSGGYGTVVIGRRGEREAFFTGRIAMRLIQKISDQALWIVC